jgi:hypothetical protein
VTRQHVNRLLNWLVCLSPSSKKPQAADSDSTPSDP